MSSTLDSFIESHKPPSLQRWLGHNDGHDTHYVFDFAHIRLSLTLSHLLANSACRIVDFTVHDSNGAVRRRDLDPIRQDVRAILRASAPTRAEETHLAILQALERVAEFENPAPAAPPAAATSTPRRRRTYSRGWNAARLDSWDEVLANPYGLDVSTVVDTAHRLLGRTPAQLVARIPAQYRILHVESVARPDLVARFLRYQRSLEQKLAGSKTSDRRLLKMMPPGRDRPLPACRDGVVAEMVRPRVTYYGTSAELVPPIVRRGFRMPEPTAVDDNDDDDDDGGAHDKRDFGIYSSRSPAEALYSAREARAGPFRIRQLVVCATVMGRTYQKPWAPLADDWFMWPRDPVLHGPRLEGFDTHCDDEFECIVHSEAAMLPCYVIYVDDGTDSMSKADGLAQPDGKGLFLDKYQEERLRTRGQVLHIVYYRACGPHVCCINVYYQGF